MQFFHQDEVCPAIRKRYKGSRSRIGSSPTSRDAPCLRADCGHWRAAFCAVGLLSALPQIEAADGLTSDWVVGHASRARLLAGNGIAGVELQMPEGWKTYWRSPGDAGGTPPTFDWSKSDNLASANVLYPAPKRFTDRAGDTVGYKGTVVFPVEVTPKDREQAHRSAVSASTTACARRSASRPRRRCRWRCPPKEARRLRRAHRRA